MSAEASSGMTAFGGPFPTTHPASTSSPSSIETAGSATSVGFGGPFPTTHAAPTSSPSSTQPAGSATSAGGAAVPTSSFSSENNSKHVNVAAIVGGVVGGIGIVVPLALLFLLLSRRTRSSSSRELRPEMEPSAYCNGHDPDFGTGAPSIMPSHPHEPRVLPNMISPATTSNTALSPRRYSQRGPVPTQQTTDELKSARQRELQRRLEAVNGEMRALQADLQDNDSPAEGGVPGAIAERNSSVRSQTRGRNDQELLNFREQIRVMSEQMERLRLQLDSAWAQGLSDDPPPGYTPYVSES